MGAFQVLVRLRSTDRSALLQWYEEEHIPLLLAIPGWLAVRQYVDLGGTDSPHLLTVHDIEHPSVFDSPGWSAATSTAWRSIAMATVVQRSRRVVRLRAMTSAHSGDPVGFP